MRSRKAFLSCTLAAAAVLVAATGAMAGGGGGHDGKKSCSNCSSYSPTVAVVAGPCLVSDPTQPACGTTGLYTGIEYAITGDVQHATALVTSNNTISTGTGDVVYPACQGDPVTNLGVNSCHEQAVSANIQNQTFWIVVSGPDQPVQTSVALANKSGCIKSIEITGLGVTLSPFQTAQNNETVNFKGCAVVFVHDPLTGNVLSATVDPTQGKPACAANQNDDTCCNLQNQDVSLLQLTLNNEPLGAGQIGDGYISSGTNSCTTRIIGGRVYTWGSPCP